MAAFEQQFVKTKLDANHNERKLPPRWVILTNQQMQTDPIKVDCATSTAELVVQEKQDSVVTSTAELADKEKQDCDESQPLLFPIEAEKKPHRIESLESMMSINTE